MDVVIASANEGKVREFREILKGKFDNILSANDIGIVLNVNETGATFCENALIKAEYVKRFTDKAVLADDSGICVDALGGAPGVFSARFSEEGSDKSNREKLIREMDAETDRRAKFVCSLCFISYDGKRISAEGEAYGEITDASYLTKGENGFGYDCVFYSYDLNTTFALADGQKKNKVSHRKRAFDALFSLLKI
jgi:XTP/dITP diphosphohydrolase